MPRWLEAVLVSRALYFALTMAACGALVGFEPDEWRRADWFRPWGLYRVDMRWLAGVLAAAACAAAYYHGTRARSSAVSGPSALFIWPGLAAVPWCWAVGDDDLLFFDWLFTRVLPACLLCAYGAVAVGNTANQ